MDIQIAQGASKIASGSSIETLPQTPKEEIKVSKFNNILNSQKDSIQLTQSEQAQAIQSQKVDPVGKNDVISGIRDIIRDLNSTYLRLDQINKDLFGGKKFMPQELLAIQAEVYRLSQEVELVSKTVGKTTDGIKTILQTQV